MTSAQPYTSAFLLDSSTWAAGDGQGQLRSTQVRGAASFPFRLHGCCVMFCCCNRRWLLIHQGQFRCLSLGEVSRIISLQAAWLLRPVLLLLI